jgi:hypothetical protein
MTTTTAALIGTKAVETSETSQYSSLNGKTIIDKFDVCNTTTNAIPFTARIVPSGGTASSTNALLPAKSVAPGETYRCPEIVGHTLERGDFISTLAGAAGLTVRASGRQVT